MGGGERETLWIPFEREAQERSKWESGKVLFQLKTKSVARIFFPIEKKN